jgi:hypothetical protein
VEIDPSVGIAIAAPQPLGVAPIKPGGALPEPVWRRAAGLGIR